MPDPAPLPRRRLLQCGVAAAAAGLVPAAAAAAPAKPTPPEVPGPFYPVRFPKDRDFDLTRVEGRDGVAAGEHLRVRGRVLDAAGDPVEDATVELWQANAAGRYAHPHDPSDAPLDPNFQGWAVVPSGADGGFAFRTVRPGSYAVTDGWDRPPHLHFKVTRAGFVPLTTQMYFPGEPLNDVDRLLLRHPEADRPRMIATVVGAGDDGTPVFDFDLVLSRVDEA